MPQNCPSSFQACVEVTSSLPHDVVQAQVLLHWCAEHQAWASCPSLSSLTCWAGLNAVGGLVSPAAWLYVTSGLVLRSLMMR